MRLTLLSDGAKEVHPSGEIIKLPCYCPWKEHLFELEEEKAGGGGGGGGVQLSTHPTVISHRLASTLIQASRHHHCLTHINHGL